MIQKGIWILIMVHFRLLGPGKLLNQILNFNEVFHIQGFVFDICVLPNSPRHTVASYLISSSLNNIPLLSLGTRQLFVSASLVK